MFDTERAAGESVDGGSVAATVVSEELLDADPVPLVEGDGAAEEADDRRCFLVGEDLGVSESAVVVDGDVDVLVADAVADDAGTVGVFRVVVLSTAADPPSGAALDATELFDVDMEQLAWPPAFVTDGRPIPIRVRIPETVESAIPSVSAISAAVKRIRRSFAIASIRSDAVRLATCRGADERSKSPAAPARR